MFDLRDYKLLNAEASDIVVAMKKMADWVNQSAMSPESFTWVLRYADLKSDEPLDPLLQCGDFIKLVPFIVDYETRNVVIEYPDDRQQVLFNELIWGLNGELTVHPRDDVFLTYSVSVDKRKILVDYHYELIEGNKVACVSVRIEKIKEKKDGNRKGSRLQGHAHRACQQN